jgi:hypothetical protein
MGSENLDAIETARRVLRALAAKHDPDPADVERLRRLAPPLAQLPLDELAAKVMQLAQMISATRIDIGCNASTDVPFIRMGLCGLRRTPRPKGANLLCLSPIRQSPRPDGKEGKCRRVLAPLATLNLTNDQNCPKPRVAPWHCRAVSG